MSELPTTQVALFGFVIFGLLGILGLILRSFNKHVNKIIDNSVVQIALDRDMHKENTKALVGGIERVATSVDGLEHTIDRHGNKIDKLIRKLGHEDSDDSK